MPIWLEKGASIDSEDRKIVKKALREKIKSESFDVWKSLFAQLDVCVEPVLKLEEALDSALAREREWVVNVPLTRESDATEPQLALPIKFSRSKSRYDFIGQPLGAGEW